MASKPRKPIDLGLDNYNELFMNEQERMENRLPRIYTIPISEIDEFPDHPFRKRVHRHPGVDPPFGDQVLIRQPAVFIQNRPERLQHLLFDGQAGSHRVPSHTLHHCFMRHQAAQHMIFRDRPSGTLQAFRGMRKYEYRPVVFFL